MPVTMSSHIPFTLESFSTLPKSKQGFFLLNAPRRTRDKILQQTSESDIIKIVNFLDPSQAAQLLHRIKKQDRRDKIISKLNTELQDKVNFLFRFAPNTAGSIMDLNYIEVEKTDSFDTIKRRITTSEKKTGRIPHILVVEEGMLLGEIPQHTLILNTKIKTKTIAQAIIPLPTIHHAEKTEQVLETLKHHPHSKVAVIDDDESILGIIYSDDIIRILQKQSSTGLYDFAGVHDEEDVFDSAFFKFRHRYKWLIINLGTAYLAASVVSLFTDTLSKFVLLAAYMPIVAGMGGNAGTQTLAVTVRGIALGEIELKNSGRALLSEIGAGFLNGLTNGVIVAVISMLWHQSPLLGLITGVAMVNNLIVAGFFGAFIPLLMKKLGKDPATSATIFITTATDVIGFFVFLGLATILLK